MTPADRLELASQLLEGALELMRENLRRRWPEEGEAGIEERLRSWLATRPGAENGDAPGRPISWPLAP